MRARLWSLAVLLPISASGRLSAAQLRLAPTALPPLAGLPAMTMRPLSAPSLYSPATPLSAPMLAWPAPGLAPMVAAPAVCAAPVLPPAAGTPPVSAAPQASKEELAFTARAALELAVLAEDWGAQRGMNARRMTGQDFLSMLDAGMALYAEQNQAQAPSPQAYAAARTVQTQMVRVVKAMLKPEEPLNGQIRRILSVWNVYNQEMEAAAQKGSFSTIEAEARLFASQVEASV